MNWTALSTIAEIVPAIAVVITLLYLANQMRQNNKLLREQAWQHMLQNQLSYYDGMAREEDLVNIVYGIPRDDIIATDAMKATSHATAEFMRRQWEFLRVKEGVFGDSEMPILAFKREW